MSKQYTKINFENFTVEDGGILYDMEDLDRLSSIYERLCTAEYLYDTYREEKNITKEEAYKMACIVRDDVENFCECEMTVLDGSINNLLWEVRKN